MSEGSVRRGGPKPPSSATSVKDKNNQWVTATPPKPFTLQDFLFDKQLKFVSDPHDFKVAVCSRRAGKTVACAAHLIDTALKNPETVSLYITLSRNNAKKIIWSELLRINRNHKLGAIPNDTDLSLTFPNGAIIYCTGAKDSSEIEKFRGLALKLVYVDECQSFRSYLEDLINDVLAPALMDYSGSLCLIGTPGPIPAGFFYDCAEKQNTTWTKHSWTFFDNPFITAKGKGTHQDRLSRELSRRGVTVADPTIQREWFGNWVQDTNSLILQYSASKNHYLDLPTGKLNYILGIDLGYIDADALAVLAWSDSSPHTFLVDEVVMTKQGLTELVAAINNLRSKYDISKMVIDEGGLGKKIAEEIRRRYHLPVQPAEKTRKMENLALLNDSLRTGVFKARAESQFAQDSYLVEIDKDKSTPDRLRISDKYHSDIIDAVLYAYRESPAFTYQAPVKGPEKGTREWSDAENERMFQAAVEHFSKEAESQVHSNGLGWPEDS